MLGGDPNLPNGGLLARFPGLYIPILNWSFNGPEPTDTQFDTVVITRQYDFFADFPLYPLNLVADLNAVLGGVYVHTYPFDVSLAPDPTTSPPIQGTHGDTDYYFFKTEDLPLFGPLRTLGVPESLIDVVEPFFKVIVELGYDRSIPPWEPTPARLIPPLNPVTVAGDLVNAIGEGINNAAAIIGLPPLLNIPAAPAEITRADVSDQTTTGQQVTDTDQTTTRQQITDTDQTTTRQQATETRRNDGQRQTAESPTPTRRQRRAADHRHPTRRQRPPFRHPSRGSVPVGTRRRAHWCAVRSGCTANRSANCSTPAMQTRQPPRPRLPAMWPRPREPRRQNRLR